MKHVIPTIIVSLLIVVAANAQTTSPPEIPTVRYCDLLANPESYDGKQIRLRAEYDSGWEHSVFWDDKCVKRWEPKKLVWAEFDDAVASNTKPATLARFEESRWRPETDRGGRITDKSRSWHVDLLVIGVFHKATSTDIGFGHTNAFPFMITVSKIERVGDLKKL